MVYSLKRYRFATARRTFAPLLMALAATQVAHATDEVYGASASYCNGSSAACTYDSHPSEATPQIAGVGYFAGAGSYSVRGGLVTASVAFNPGAPMLLQPGTYDPAASATLNYTFQVVGAPDTYVPVTIGANITAGPIHAADDQGNPWQLVDNPDHPGPNDGLLKPSNYQVVSSASIRVFQASTNVGINKYEVYNTLMGDRNLAVNPQGVGMNINEVYFFKSNTDITVSLFAQAWIQYSTIYDTGDNSQYGSVTASADPVFSIADPAFGAFALTGVPDGPGPAPVPEPSTWALLSIGLVIAGAAKFRDTRRRSSQRFPKTGF